jgi:hypothetical protein
MTIKKKVKKYDWTATKLVKYLKACKTPATALVTIDIDGRTFRVTGLSQFGVIPTIVIQTEEKCELCD